jgi:hypothetical protein
LAGQADRRHAAESPSAAEPRRQELFRRLNLAPGGTAALVNMRAQLLDTLDRRPDLAAVNSDFIHLFFVMVQSRPWCCAALTGQHLR